MTTIEWSDETWNPTVGCSRVSAGCDHCYAMGVAHRKMTPRHRGLTILRPPTAARPGIDWNGKVRLVPEALDKPMGWRKPRRVFVDSMSDLFHPQVPFEFIAAVFGVMAMCPQHTFQVLTKRPARMLEFFEWAKRTWPQPGPAHTALQRECLRRATGWPGGGVPDPALWPTRNVHLGVSVEDQATADERIPLLAECPAALWFVSYEPALGPVDFTGRIGDRGGPHVDWIIVGGESGPGARPFDIAWARSVLEQCEGTSVKVFVKQLGAFPHSYGAAGYMSSLTHRQRFWTFDEQDQSGSIVEYRFFDRSGGDMAEWPADLRVREAPPCTDSPAWDAAMARVET